MVVIVAAMMIAVGVVGVGVEVGVIGVIGVTTTLSAVKVLLQFVQSQNRPDESKTHPQERDKRRAV